MIEISKLVSANNITFDLHIHDTSVSAEVQSPLCFHLSAELPVFNLNTFRYNGITYYIPNMYKIKDVSLVEQVLSNNLVLEIPEHFRYLTFEEVLIEFGIYPAASTVIESFLAGRIKYDEVEFNRIFQGQIDNFLTSSSITRYVAGNVSSNKILIHIPTAPTQDVRFRLPWIKVSKDAELDLASISVSGKNVGLVVSEKNDEVFGKIMQNVLLPAHTRKVVGARSSIENSEDLLNPEHPIVIGKRNDIKGTNLLAAVVTAKYNQYDAIMIRNHPSVIEQLACIKRHTMVVSPDDELLVNIGSAVNPYAPVCRDTFGITTLFKSHTRGCVVDIEKLEGRTILYIDCIYPLRPGDKMDTRTHYKGVVHLCDDDEMPQLEITPNVQLRQHHKISDTHFIPDMVVDPIGLAKRANFSMLYEMALSISKTPNCQGRTIHDKELVNELTNGTYLECPISNIAIGYVYVFRPNKHASDSPVESDATTDIINSHGWQTDSTVNGARVNLTMMSVLSETYDIQDIVDWSNLHRDLSVLEPFTKLLAR